MWMWQFTWNAKLYFLWKKREKKTTTNQGLFWPQIFVRETRGPRATGRSPEWHSHCRYADVMQHFSSPVIAANEKINLQAVLNFEEKYYIWHDSQWSMIIWTNSQSHFNSRINVKFGGNWLIVFWRIMILYSTAQVKEPKNSLFRISAFRELAKNTRNQTE